MEINSLFFYENKKFRPQGGSFVYVSDVFEGAKIKFFRIISKQIPNLVSLYSLVLESLKIYWKLIVYFSIKILNGVFRSYNSYNINLLTIFQDSLCFI